ncbi:MAG: methytransferase partner Trm112 [Methanofollis sp.]|nr:methytransferase partner Trm112 [Methanofollis sp.]
MKRSLLPILCCPVCKGDLELRVVEEKDEDIIEGSLFCSACGVEYPIREGIPNLLPPTTDQD